MNLGRAVSWLAAASATVAVMACGSDGSTSVVPVASLVLSPTTASVAVGATTQLTATPYDAGGGVLTGRAITWSSSSAFATVSASGLVSGVTVGGPVSITATSEGKTASASVTVIPPPVASVVVAPANPSVVIGGTVQLNATTLDGSGNQLTGRAVSWASDNSAVAAVTASGLVSAVALGTAHITATSEGRSGQATITVVPPPVATVTVSPATLSVALNGTAQLSAILKDAAGNTLTGRTVTWSSSNTAIVSVSSQGLVTGVAVGGPVTITASSEGKTGTATASVVTGFLSVATGESHSCGIRAGGAIYCWGYNGAGQLGDGTVSDRLSPTRVSGTTAFAGVDLGGHHSCALATTGTAFCWGNNGSGQIGDGTSTLRIVPTAVSFANSLSSISTGGLYLNLSAFNLGILDVAHSCGIAVGGAGFCWGDNADGQIGDGSTITRRTPVAISGGLTFGTLRAGVDNTCGITLSGVAYCWGWNGYGQVGDGSLTTRMTPTALAGGLNFAAIDVGDDFACGITIAGAAYCWGYNARGEIGDGSKTDRSTPTAVSGGLTFRSIVAGEDHACALTAAGVAYCWGANTFGQLGDGTTTDRVTPTLVLGGQQFAMIATSYDHTCAVTVGGQAYCWGSNSRGQLGDGTTTDRSVPVLVNVPAGSVAARATLKSVEVQPQSVRAQTLAGCNTTKHRGRMRPGTAVFDSGCGR